MLFVRAQIPKNRSILKRFSKSHQFMLTRSRVRPFPQIRTRIYVHDTSFLQESLVQLQGAVSMELGEVT